MLSFRTSDVFHVSLLKLKLFPVKCNKKLEFNANSKKIQRFFPTIQCQTSKESKWLLCSMQWDSNSRNNLNKFQKKTILWISAKLLTNQKSGGIIPIVGDVWLTNDTLNSNNMPFVYSSLAWVRVQDPRIKRKREKNAHRKTTLS